MNISDTQKLEGIIAALVVFVFAFFILAQDAIQEAAQTPPITVVLPNSAEAVDISSLVQTRVLVEIKRAEQNPAETVYQVDNRPVAKVNLVEEIVKTGKHQGLLAIQKDIPGYADLQVDTLLLMGKARLTDISLAYTMNQ